MIRFDCPLELVIEERIWHLINEVIEHLTSTFMIAYRRPLLTLGEWTGGVDEYGAGSIKSGYQINMGA